MHDITQNKLDEKQSMVTIAGGQQITILLPDTRVSFRLLEKQMLVSMKILMQDISIAPPIKEIPKERN
jgi:hypothetical protein